MRYKQLNSGQRYTIQALLRLGIRQKIIAEMIGVNPSTISREIRRNCGKKGCYNAITAQANAIYKKQRTPGNRSVSKKVKHKAIFLLCTCQWSPVQISAVLRKSGEHISHETIYRIIRQDKKNGGTIYKNCRHALKHRHHIICGKCASIPERISIAQRPPQADGTRFGDFEMDTIVGPKNKGAALTIVERKTGMIFARKLTKGKDAKALAKEVVKILWPYRNIVKTITTDNGKEFACHKYITKKLGCTVYFADPYSSWQKGAIENANGLIRQYVPKNMNLYKLSQRKLQHAIRKINDRPRKRLHFNTPYDCFYKSFYDICTC